MEKQKSNLIIKMASSAEFDKIHALNHQIFAKEIPQHPQNAQEILIDSFHEKNTYFVAMEGEELIGMICYNAIRPFSLDRKLPNLDSWLPFHKKLVEIRLFAVKPEKRKTGVAIALLKATIVNLINKGYDLGVVSAITREIPMYSSMGGVPFGALVGTEEAPFQPMYFYISNLKSLFKP